MYKYQDYKMNGSDQTTYLQCIRFHIFSFLSDESPPSFEYCPESQTLISTADKIQVYWRPPLARDPQSGVTVRNTHKLGTQFPANEKTIVKYTATNGEGQTSVCSFTFNVKQIKVGLGKYFFLPFGPFISEAGDNECVCFEVCN